MISPGQQLAALRKQVRHTCPECGEDFTATLRAIYCTEKCKKAAKMTNNLLQWALDTQPIEDYPTPAERKRALLVEINRACGTRYSEPHLNNWLAGRKATPHNVWRHLAAEYITDALWDSDADDQVIIKMLSLRG